MQKLKKKRYCQYIQHSNFPCGARNVDSTRSPLGNDTKKYLHSRKLRNKLCTSRIVTIIGNGNNARVTKSEPHDHTPGRELAEAKMVKYNLNQEKLKNTGKYPSTILRDELPRVARKS